MALHGSSVGLLIDGFNMAPYFNEFSMSSDQAMHDATVFGNTSRVKMPGLKDGKANGTGFFDNTATVGSWAVLKGKYTGSTPASASPAAVALGVSGFTVGNRVAMGYFDEAQLGFKSIIDGLEMLTFTGDADQDGIDYGVSLHAIAQESSFPVTGTAVDNAAASVNGGVGVIHMTGIGGGAPSLIFKIQHSTDNLTWIDLITYSPIGTVGVLRTEVAAGTTVRRYLRVLASENGTTTSVAFVAAFARR